MTKLQEQKWVLIQSIQKEHIRGKSISQLARDYHLNWRTIKKYINMRGVPSNTRQRKRPTDLYKHEIPQLESKVTL
ncbi:hypothetical protein [Niallia sp. 03133]|uniref:hypothetical protein n=1 Tax=Niallia sp. 03133 TaxID=3458060 RepID=UPI004043F11F